MIKRAYAFLQRKIGSIEIDIYDISKRKKGSDLSKHYFINLFSYLTIGIRYIFYGVLEFIIKFFVLIFKSPENGYKILVAPIEKFELDVEKIREEVGFSNFSNTHKKARKIFSGTFAASVATIVIISLLLNIFIPIGQQALGATYTFQQTSWLGGSDGGSPLPVDPTNRTNWTKYSTKDANTSVSSTNGSLSLATTTDSSIKTLTADFNNDAISAGSLGLKNTQILDDQVTLSSSDLATTTAISGGASHSLALKSDGTVWAWGSNANGELGDGTTIDKRKPVQVSGLTGVTAISGGAYFSLALKSDGTVWSWGHNYQGKLGDGTTTTRYTPVQVLGLTGVTAISTKNSHSLALKSDGTVWSWGRNIYGQIGDGTTTYRLLPVQVCLTYSGSCTAYLTGVTAISG
ncbi:MAG: hypothetical protein AAB614_02910, partial [Patescibacteria group bacterium]